MIARLKYDFLYTLFGIGGGFGVLYTVNRQYDSPNALGRRKRNLGFPRMDVDASPPSDSGGRELFPEGSRKRVTEEPGQAGNGAALLGAMGALG